MPEGDTLAELVELQKRHTAAEREADRARGALNEVLGRLRKEFGCNTLKAAREKLTELNKQEAELFEEFRQAKAKYEAEYGEKNTNNT